MSSLRIREATRPDWEGVVVEIWEDDDLVGQAWRDDEEVLVEFLPDEGEARLVDLPDLLRVLDTVARILEAPGEEGPGDGPDPVDALAAEFDHLAVQRGEDDEGFYPVEVAVPFVRRAESLGLAVVSLEGFSVVAGEVVPEPGHSADLGDAHRGEPWPTFRAGCNVQAEAILERWPRRRGFLIAFEVRDADGEDYVF